MSKYVVHIDFFDCDAHIYIHNHFHKSNPDLYVLVGRYGRAWDIVSWNFGILFEQRLKRAKKLAEKAASHMEKKDLLNSQIKQRFNEMV